MYIEVVMPTAQTARSTAPRPTSPAPPPDATSPITDIMYAAAPKPSTSATITKASSAVTACARPIGERSTGSRPSIGRLGKDG